MERVKRAWMKAVLASALGAGLAAGLAPTAAEAKGGCSFAIYGTNGCGCASGSWTRCVVYQRQCINVASCDAIVLPRR